MDMPLYDMAMNRTERLYKLDRLLRSSRPVPFGTLQAELGVSRATLFRDLAYLRDFLDAPLEQSEWGRQSAYRYSDSSRPQLPGHWLTPDELRALYLGYATLHTLDRGPAGELIGPIEARLRGLLQSLGVDLDAGRLMIAKPRAARPCDPAIFAQVLQAVERERCLWLRYAGRQRRATTERVIEPVRLLFHREGWYVYGWCREAGEPRLFALERIVQLRVLDEPVVQVADAAELTTGYGVLMGEQMHEAVLHFSPERAEWVRDEIWHPEQRQELRSDGSLVLRVPYHESAELMGEILRHGDAVRVLAPRRLHSDIVAAARAIVAHGRRPTKKAGAGRRDQHRQQTSEA